MKNISFFLVPKQDVVFVLENYTVRQAVEKMEYHKYSAVPIIDDKGMYVGTLTEGDLLWYLKDHPEIRFIETNKIPLTSIARKKQNRAVSINENMEDLFDLALTQNFVPVVDDGGIFIGIVRRREIMEYFIGKEARVAELSN